MNHENTAPSAAHTDLLACPMAAHEMAMGPLTHQPEGCDAPYTFQHHYLDLGGVKIGFVEGDSRVRKTPGYPHASLAEAQAIHAELIRRWNAHTELLEALKRIADAPACMQSDAVWMRDIARAAIAKATTPAA